MKNLLASEPPAHRTMSSELGSGGAGPLVVPVVPPGCAEAIVDDDGSVESGYGWVPSSTEGIFLQEYQGEEVPSGFLESVCVCWLRTRMDDTIDFEIVLYEHNGSHESPPKEPFAAVPAQLAGVPLGVPGATFAEVPLGGVPVPDGPFYLGVRWDPSVDDFFFICVDKTSAPEPPTRVFFRDNTFPAGWAVSDQTSDPTFDDHQALLVRPVPAPAPEIQPIADVPLGDAARFALVIALLATGALMVRRL
ncbi:MAG: hypothetical protein MPN21_03210 [Thermoanaerobaculia bacterium]|nr:hypothetical protein [Thermoanaerobaculia bacterium]